MAGLSQDTTGAPFPVLPPGDSTRPQPTDAPGSDAAGWRKVGAVTDGGWSPIDDVAGSGDAGWRQT